MKSIRLRLLAFIILLGIGFILFARNGSTLLAIEGGQYVLGWHVAGFGGGASTGGDYTLSNTVGQGEANALEGGDYDLGGGFWGGGIRVAAPVTPTATPMPTATSVDTPTATPTTPGNPTPTPTTPGNPGADIRLYLPLVDQ